MVNTATFDGQQALVVLVDWLQRGSRVKREATPTISIRLTLTTTVTHGVLLFVKGVSIVQLFEMLNDCRWTD